MADFLDFLHMGGYAAYVWSSYALSFLTLGGIVLWSALEHRKVRRETLRRARVPRRSRA